jgi:epsilon-lactone hydrolase
VKAGLAGKVSATAGVLVVSLLLVAIAANRDAASEPTPEAPAAGASETLEYSSFLSKEVRERLQYFAEFGKEGKLQEAKSCGRIDGKDTALLADCKARLLYDTSLYKDLRSRYPVTISAQVVGGIRTEVFTPADGIAPRNTQRVLINLHGGGFRTGWKTISHFESIPIASVAKIKVISVDYRMAPRHFFPAASEDVKAVYAELIKHYDPNSIGIYGCSAGGLLTAQSTAWLQKEKLPTPGAVGMFCSGASFWSEGDSGNFAKLWEQRPKTLRDDPYFEYLKKTRRDDALAYPVRSREIMSRFPPSLLITSTRDLALSSVVHTHSVLVQQQVPAELYVWEGLPHSFFVDPALPQSREMYELTARFFDRYLGRPHLDSKRTAVE